MHKEADTHQTNTAERERVEKALRVAIESFDILFDHAPVMMHAVDKDGRLVRVNSRWLQTLGYESSEVLGRRNIEFLTEESRTQGKEGQALFWRVGSARNIRVRFVRKDGRILDTLLDAEICGVTMMPCSAYATLRVGDDLVQWEQASTTITALKQLTLMQGKLESALSPRGSDNPDADPPALQQSSGHAPEAGLTGEFLGAALEVAQDIPANLRALQRVLEEWRDATVEQQGELLLVAKRIDKTLTDLADTVATARWPSE